MKRTEVILLRGFWTLKIGNRFKITLTVLSRRSHCQVLRPGTSFSLREKGSREKGRQRRWLTPWMSLSLGISSDLIFQDWMDALGTIVPLQQEEHARPVYLISPKTYLACLSSSYGLFGRHDQASRSFILLQWERIKKKYNNERRKSVIYRNAVLGTSYVSDDAFPSITHGVDKNQQRSFFLGYVGCDKRLHNVHTLNERGMSWAAVFKYQIFFLTISTMWRPRRGGEGHLGSKNKHLKWSPPPPSQRPLKTWYVKNERHAVAETRKRFWESESVIFGYSILHLVQPSLNTNCYVYTLSALGSTFVMPPWNSSLERPIQNRLV